MTKYIARQDDYIERLRCIWYVIILSKDNRIVFNILFIFICFVVLTWSPFQLEEIEICIKTIIRGCILLKVCMLISIEWPERSEMESRRTEFRTNILSIIDQLLVSTTFSEVYLTRRRPGAIKIEPWQEPNCCKQIFNPFMAYLMMPSVM